MVIVAIADEFTDGYYGFTEEFYFPGLRTLFLIGYFSSPLLAYFQFWSFAKIPRPSWVEV